jgi:hypothetical protein
MAHPERLLRPGADLRVTLTGGNRVVYGRITSAPDERGTFRIHPFGRQTEMELDASDVVATDVPQLPWAAYEAVCRNQRYGFFVRARAEGEAE